MGSASVVENFKIRHPDHSEDNQSASPDRRRAQSIRQPRPEACPINPSSRPEACPINPSSRPEREARSGGTPAFAFAFVCSCSSFWRSQNLRIGPCRCLSFPRPADNAVILSKVWRALAPNAVEEPRRTPASTLHPFLSQISGPQLIAHSS